MKKIFSLIVLAVFAFYGYAQTDVEGDVSGTWNFAGSPYDVVGDLIISEGNTLTIEAGVEVVFTGHYSFEIYGIMEANGTEEAGIIVFSANQDDGWNGLKFIDQTGDVVSNLKYCEITDCIKSGVDSSGGGVFLDNADITMNHVLIHGNTAAGYGGGMYMYNSDPIMDYVDIYENTANFDGGGFFCFNSSPQITKALIVENSTPWEGGAFACFDNSNPVIVGATITNNSAIEYGPAIAALYNSTISLVNCIVYNNYFGTYLSDSSEIYETNNGAVNAYYSDIRNGTGEDYFNEDCIEADPDFVYLGLPDDVNNNYELQGSSPCIDAGNPDSQYNDPDGSFADMGRYFYEQSGVRGTVVLDTECPPEVTMSDITIEVYHIFDAQEPDTLYATSEVNDNGTFFIELLPGNYRVRCFVDYFQVFADHEENNVTVEEGLLVTLDPFYINGVLPGHAVGKVWINTLSVDNTDQYNAIQITSNSPNSSTTSPYPRYDIFGFIQYWEYYLEVPAIDSLVIIAHLAGYEDSYSDPVIITSGDDVDIDDITLYAVEYPATITGTVTFKDDPLLPPQTGNVEDVLIYYDENIQNGVHPNENGFYSLPTFDGIRKVTAVLEGFADSKIFNIFVTPGGTTENVDLVMLPWVMAGGDQFEMSVFATTSLNGEFLMGDTGVQIAAFGSDGICCGIGGWNTGNHPFWDTATYYYDLPGYWYFTLMYTGSEGEIITFRAYNPATDEFYDFDNYGLLFEDDTWANVINLIDNSIVYQQDFELVQNWNWISFNLGLDDYSVDSVLDPLAPFVEEIGTQDSHANNPNGSGWIPLDYAVNNIDAFKMNMLTDGETLTLDGSRINPIVHPIYLDWQDQPYNWNWVAFINPNLEQPSLPLDIALESVKNVVIQIKTQNKSAFNDNGTWIGDLAEMTIGEGYLIDVVSYETLFYPGIGYYSIRGDEDSYTLENIANWKLIKGNDSNMVLMADLGIDHEYEAGVFDDEGNCQSIGKYENGFWYFTVLGNELDETLHLRAYNKKSGETVSSLDTFNYCANTRLGDPKNPIKFEFEDLNSTQPITKITLEQNHPNPFNPVTTFSFSLPNSSEVSLKVYNIKGQLVETLVDEARDSGTHEIIWDASQHGSGVYFYKLVVGGNSPIIKKCIMLK